MIAKEFKSAARIVFGGVRGAVLGMVVGGFGRHLAGYTLEGAVVGAIGGLAVGVSAGVSGAAMAEISSKEFWGWVGGAMAYYAGDQSLAYVGLLPDAVLNASCTVAAYGYAYNRGVAALSVPRP